MGFVLHVVGARPNFMKVSPLMAALGRRGVLQRLVHTGQHFDGRMSGVFFEELGLPRPDADLGVGSGSHGEQTARTMIALERFIAGSDPRPSLVVVPGDVNSTVAAALVAAKLNVPVAHLEAGLRSYDRTMPEEVNRVVTDHVSQLLLTPSPDADENLRREGLLDRAVLVGNLMIDTLRAHLPRARDLGVPRAMGLEPGRYAVVTLHRPSNVDEPEALLRLLGALGRIARELPVVFPVHPRTRARLANGLAAAAAPLTLVDPQGYLEFLSLTSSARLVLTDSGGLQEESTALGVPCLTLRENTERPITVSEGTNEVVGTDPERIVAAALRALASPGPARCPALWDGRAGERAADAVVGFLADGGRQASGPGPEGRRGTEPSPGVR
jgi:UDP-N-acetylglucosamine 2-epimerase (non-hydrolysing)